MRKFEFKNHGYYHIYNRGVDKRDIFMSDNDFLRFLKALWELNNTLQNNQRSYIEKLLIEGRDKELGDFLKKNLGCEASKETRLSSLAKELSLVSDTPTPQPKNHPSIKKTYKQVISSFPKLVDINCYCLNPNHFHLVLKQLVDKGIAKFMHRIGISYTNYFNYKNNRSGSLLEGIYKATLLSSYSDLLYLSCYVNGNPEIHGFSKAKYWRWSSCKEYLNQHPLSLCNFKPVLEKFTDIANYEARLDSVIALSKEIKSKK